MRDLFFWKNWPTPDRSVYGLVWGIMILSWLQYLIQYWIGDGTLVGWITQSELEDLPVVLDSFRRGIFQLQADGLNYLITERFVATDMAVNHLASGVYLTLLVAGAVIGITVLTFLSRFWYGAGMAVFILLLVGFRFELLSLFGQLNSTPVAFLLVLYGGLSYYFHAFRTDASLTRRLLSFSLLTALTALVVGLFASIDYPVLHLTSYGIIVPLLISIAFTFVISAEIPYAFLELVTRSNTEGSRNSLLHFTVAGAFYLLNLLVIYLKNAGIVDLDILYISPFLIYAVSVVLGIWGHRKRRLLFEAILPYEPYGALFYAALAIISTATFGYLFATANDPLVEVFEDVVVFSHLAMGVMFFLYVMVNFGDLLRQNLKVYKVVYKPTRMPYFTARGAALLIILGLFFYANMAPYRQATSGYYNGLGDLSTATKEYFLAEQYYKLGSQYGWNNHKSNYALASLARVQNDPIATEYYFKQATLKNPKPYDYANLGHVQIQGEQFFEALFTLKEGVRRFPESGELFNNLALLYYRTSLADSAFLFFDLSRQFARQTEVPESNLLAFWAKNAGFGHVDSLLSRTKSLDYLPYLNNQTVLQNIAGAKVSKQFRTAAVADSALNRNTFAYLFNQAVGQAAQPDTTLSRRLAALEQHPDNGLYAEELAFARASYEYRYGDRGKAIELLKNLSRQATDRADFFNGTLGAWLLQQEAYRLSAEYSARSKEPSARFNRAVAFSEGGMIPEALAAWQQIVRLADSVRNDKKPLSLEYGEMKPLAEKMLAIYNPATNPESLDEEGKVMYLLYRGETLSEATRTQFADLMPKVRELRNQPDPEGGKILAQAHELERKGALNQAEALYQRALLREPLNEALIIQASQFYRDQRQNNEQAYNLLVNAVQLNPYGVPVYKAYIRQCLDMGLLSYAEQGLSTLKEITTPADYQAFLPEYRSKLALIEKKAAGFQ